MTIAEATQTTGAWVPSARLIEFRESQYKDFLNGVPEEDVDVWLHHDGQIIVVYLQYIDGFVWAKNFDNLTDAEKYFDQLSNEEMPKYDE